MPLVQLVIKMFNIVIPWQSFWCGVLRNNGRREYMEKGDEEQMDHKGK